jgi:hypothetical protein
MVVSDIRRSAISWLFEIWDDALFFDTASFRLTLRDYALL